VTYLLILVTKQSLNEYYFLKFSHEKGVPGSFYKIYRIEKLKIGKYLSEIWSSTRLPRAAARGFRPDLHGFWRVFDDPIATGPERFSADLGPRLAVLCPGGAVHGPLTTSPGFFRP